jgi:ADP-heptose:LPS heptosyltransferase
MEKIKKILVIRSDAIGDMTLTLPAIKTIKDHYPNVHITVLASPINSQLIEHLDYVDDIILKENPKGILETWKYSRKLKQHNFDCAIHFRTKGAVAWACKWSIKYNIGHKNFIGLLPIFNKHGFWFKPHNRTQHVSEAFMEFIAPLGINTPSDYSLDIDVPNAWKDEAKPLLSERRDNVPLICIHPGVGHGNRPVTPKQYIEYIQELRQHRDCDIVITGASPAEIEYKNQILDAGFPNIIDAAGKTSVKSLAGLLSQCDLYVAVDTGPSHMATAIGVPQLAIFPSKRVKPLSWGPWNNRHFIVRNNHNCFYDCPHQHCPYDICSDDINIQDMVDKTQTLLAGGGINGIQEQRNYWFKTCMNILLLYDDTSKHDTLELRKTLSDWGIHTFAKHYKDPTLPTVIRENDIAIIHNIPKKRILRLWLMCQKANKQLHHPPLLLTKRPVVQSYSECVSDYIKHFSERGFF